MKIRSTVCKKTNNSPRLNNENIGYIKKDPENGNNYGFKREKQRIMDFKYEHNKARKWITNKNLNEYFNEAGVLVQEDIEPVREACKVYNLST